MTAAEWWSLFAVIAAGAAVVLWLLLALRLPTQVHTFAERLAGALLAGAVGCLGAALLIAF